MKLWLAAMLLAVGAPLKAQDLLACAPGDESTAKPLAICAAAVGGCAAASSFASTNERRFLQGQTCDALVSRITGQGYDLSDFLGSAIIEGLSIAGDESNRQGNSLTGAILKLMAVGGKLYQFANCVESARAMCQARYRTSAAELRRTDGDPIRATVESYYAALSNGNVELASSLRADNPERFQSRFAQATHTFKVNDITVRNCSGAECDIAGDIIAVPKVGGNQERWLVSIRAIQGADGTWRISRISGVDLFAQLTRMTSGFFKAVSDGDRELASSFWLTPPESLKQEMHTNFMFRYEMWFPRVDQLNADLKFNINITPPPRGTTTEYSGTAAAVNDNGRWKFTRMSLVPKQ